ncbi:MAG: hypothetical protein JO264_02845 [Acidisphaera sp.]|nr:hypothetical protein [Acidisphaera sp.]
MKLDRASAIVNAVLYEGYILYPYRPSSIKNRQRWTFGGVFPRDHAEHGGSDPCTVQTQCLLQDGPATAVEIRVRFLHIVSREIGALATPLAELPPVGEPAFTRVASLQAGGAEYLAWEEATEREVVAPLCRVRDLLEAPVETAFAFPGDRRIEPIREDGKVVGLVIRTTAAVQGRLTIAAERVAADAVRLSLRISNETPLATADRASREHAQLHAFASTHTLLGVTDGAFVSLLDPPEALRTAAEACDNQGCFPVLVGAEGDRDLMLSSPIILYDYPQVAPESPGDLFDGCEIDEILTLRILTLTDAEKREVAAADARARALLMRTERLTPAELARLHGTMRPVRGRAESSGLQIGDRVRLHPKKGADIMDIVLREKLAIVEAIEHDFEDRVHVAVTIVDDPGRDLGMDRMPGHRFFFGLDELERVPAEDAA